MNIRTQINEIENRKTVKTIYKFDKLLAGLSNRKRELAQITIIRNEEETLQLMPQK